MPTIDRQQLGKTLGQHSRLAVPFSWTIGGVPVDLEADGYTARVWLLAIDGTTLTGPVTATVSGMTATYQLAEGDLDEAMQSGNSKVRIVCVAENGTTTLVSDALEITVGQWIGSGEYTPVGS